MFQQSNFTLHDSRLHFHYARGFERDVLQPPPGPHRAVAFRVTHDPRLPDAVVETVVWMAVHPERRSAPLDEIRKVAHEARRQPVAGETIGHRTAGKPLVLMLTEGQMSDHKGARLMFDVLPEAKALIADKGYDSDAFREALMARGTEPCIPPRRSRKTPLDYDKTLYK